MPDGHGARLNIREAELRARSLRTLICVPDELLSFGQLNLANFRDPPRREEDLELDPRWLEGLEEQVVEFTNVWPSDGLGGYVVPEHVSDDLIRLLRNNEVAISTTRPPAARPGVFEQTARRVAAATPPREPSLIRLDPQPQGVSNLANSRSLTCADVRRAVEEAETFFGRRIVHRPPSEGYSPVRAWWDVEEPAVSCSFGGPPPAGCVAETHTLRPGASYQHVGADVAGVTVEALPGGGCTLTVYRRPEVHAANLPCRALKPAAGFAGFSE